MDVLLTPQSAVFSTNAARPPPNMVLNEGTNFPVFGLAFNGAADEFAYWRFRAIGYTSGNLTLIIAWYADSTTSGDVIWNARIAAITPNTDSQDVETDALATANTVTDAHLGTTAQRLHTATITISNLDSLAADDDVVIEISRDANAAGDTLNNVDAIVVWAHLNFT